MPFPKVASELRLGDPLGLFRGKLFVAYFLSTILLREYTQVLQKLPIWVTLLNIEELLILFGINFPPS